MSPKVTIVICTFNRSNIITETIPTIFHQDGSSINYDVIIVNNNSNDGTSEILEEFSNKYKNLMVVNEQKQGLSHAKNTGMIAAKTSWIVYLDDDAKVPHDFVNKTLNNIEKSDFSCFGGVYLPWYKHGKPKWYKDEYASNANKLPNFGILQNDFISGGVMAIKRDLLLKYNGFSTKIGMKGYNTAYGEETLLQIMLRKDGYDIGYDPNWIIYHLVSDYKLSAGWFLKSGYASGRDYWTIYDDIPTMKKLFILFYRIFKSFFINFYKYTHSLFRNNYFIQNWIIDLINPIVIKWGQLIGGLKLIFGKNVNK